jgi:hypothetical protein
MNAYIPEIIRESAPMHATRLDLVAANRRGQNLALADAHQKASELFLAMDAYLRALKGLQACGASKAFLWDAGAGAHDQASNVMGRIDRELDAQGLYPLDALDLSELDAFLEKVK